MHWNEQTQSIKNTGMGTGCERWAERRAPLHPEAAAVIVSGHSVCVCVTSHANSNLVVSLGAAMVVEAQRRCDAVRCDGLGQQ